MPLVSDLQVWMLIPDDLGTAGVVGAGLTARVDPAAQAEAEVERSEGEGEAQGRPVVGGRRACEERAVRRSAGVRVDGWSGGRLACDLGVAFWPSPGGAGRAGRCDLGLDCWGCVQYLFVSVRGSERLCVRICVRRYRPKDGIGGVRHGSASGWRVERIGSRVCTRGDKDYRLCALRSLQL